MATKPKKKNGIWNALKKQPAILITLIVVVIVIIFLVAQNGANNNPSDTNATTSGQGTLSGAGGYYILGDSSGDAGWASAYNSLVASLHTTKHHGTVHGKPPKHGKGGKSGGKGKKPPTHHGHGVSHSGSNPHNTKGGHGHKTYTAHLGK